MLTPSSLEPFINQGIIYVAYSGGLDSTVLLHQVLKLGGRVKALHAHYDIGSETDFWRDHCLTQCARWHIPCEIIPIRIDSLNTANLEALERKLRYEAFKQYLSENDCLLTAHHRKDQAETLLLQLFRGAGIKGLAAMPKKKRLGSGYHLRPFLAYEREDLLTYAQAHRLNWIEDKRNENLRFDRNYIRHVLLPQLTERWPGLIRTLDRTARHCAEAEIILKEQALADLKQVQQVQNQLSVSEILKLSESRQKNLLRYWLAMFGCILPNEKRLIEIQKKVLQAQSDACPRVSWGQFEVRRYRNYLSVVKIQALASTKTLHWNLQQPLLIPGIGLLKATPILGQGISCARLKEIVCIQFRVGGERMHPVGRTGSHPLKKLFQEWGLPPWVRFRFPLIYQDHQLVAVPNYAIAHSFAAQADELGWVISFSEI